MVVIKNYIVTKNEYEMASRRLERLENRKVRLKSKITSCTSKLKEVVTSSSFNNDKMPKYVAVLVELEKEIEEVKEELFELKSDLDYMDSRISNIKELKEQVFVMYFIKGMQVKDIAATVYCDISTVYKKIREIKKEREAAKKSQSFGDII